VPARDRRQRRPIALGRHLAREEAVGLGLLAVLDLLRPELGVQLGVLVVVARALGEPRVDRPGAVDEAYPIRRQLQARELVDGLHRPDPPARRYALADEVVVLQAGLAAGDGDVGPAVGRVVAERIVALGIRRQFRLLVVRIVRRVRVGLDDRLGVHERTAHWIECRRARGLTLLATLLSSAVVALLGLLGGADRPDMPVGDASEDLRHREPRLRISCTHKFGHGRPGQRRHDVRGVVEDLHLGLGRREAGEEVALSRVLGQRRGRGRVLFRVAQLVRDVLARQSSPPRCNARFARR